MPAISGEWTLGTVFEHFTLQMAAQAQTELVALAAINTAIEALDQRHLALRAADDARQRDLATEKDQRYQQRFEGEEQAREKALAAAQTATDAAFAAAKEATLKAEKALTERLAAVNEFRQTLTDQQATFALKGEVSALIAGLVNQIADLQSQLADVRHRIDTAGGAHAGKSASNANMLAVMGLAVVMVGVLVAVATFALAR
jgi:hypothetical protein